MKRRFHIPLPEHLSDDALYAFFLRSVAPPDQASPTYFSSAREGSISFGEMTWCMRTKGRGGYSKRAISSARIESNGGIRSITGEVRIGYSDAFALLFFFVLFFAAFFGWIRPQGSALWLYAAAFAWTAIALAREVFTADSFLKKFVSQSEKSA